MFKGLPKLYDLVINVSPGTTKSTVCSIMFPAWIWTRMPEAQVIGASYSYNLATDLSRRCRDIIISDKYRKVFYEVNKAGEAEPLIKLRSDQNVKTNYMNQHGGFRVGVGTGGVTGFHGHFIIVDDPLDPNEAHSEAELKAANIWITDTLSQRKVDKAETPTILIMQRLHPDDPTQTLIDVAEELQRYEGGDLKLKHICLPAELADNVKPKGLRKYYRDGLMDPVRLSRPVLNENRVKVLNYSGQFQQHPLPLGAGMFQWEKIHIDSSPLKWKRKVRFWDKAATKESARNRKPAFTVGLLMGEDRNGRFWVLDIVRGRWDSATREKIIKDTAIMDGTGIKIGIEQEPGSAGKVDAENTMKTLAGFRVSADRPTGDKAVRAEPFSVQVNAGNVYMVKAEWNKEYLKELEHFPESTFKDQVDASSGAFNKLFKKQYRVGGLW